MGWTAYRNGHWSLKKTSSATISAAAAQELELEAQFDPTLPLVAVWTELKVFRNLITQI